MKRVAMVVGTRPEAIKLASVAQALRIRPGIETRIIATAQHRELLDQAMIEVGLVADIDLDLMTHSQPTSFFTGRCLAALGEVFAAEQPDYVIGQGDTNTALAAAQAAHHARIPFGHVEAGLRSGQPDRPFPEEMNRRLVGLLAHHHFCPTPDAQANLLREGIEAETIHVTGNTVIDMVLSVAHSLPAQKPANRSLLITIHRSENVASLPTIVTAVRALLDLYPDLRVCWPLHPNPRLAPTIYAALGSHPGSILRAPYPIVLSCA